MRVCAVILNWRAIEDTYKCLMHLSLSNYKDLVAVVYDNGSEVIDELKDLVKTIKDLEVTVIGSPTNSGYATGINDAIRYAKEKYNAEYYLLLNNDAFVDENTVKELVRVIELDKSIGVVNSVVYNMNSTTIQQEPTAHINYWLGDVIGMDGYSRIFNIKPTLKRVMPFKVWHTGFWCALISKACLDAVGEMAEFYFFTWESVDYSERIKRAGYKVFCAPKASVWHKWRTANILDGKTEYYNPRNRFIFMRKYATKPQYLSFILFFFGIHIWLAISYYLLIKRRPDILGKYIKGIIDGIVWKKE